jgi:hypothetical protein
MPSIIHKPPVEALLAAYFFALMAKALMERQLRRAMQKRGIESLPMYPEMRGCRRPTAHRVIELFALVQRHEWLTPHRRIPQQMVTELPLLQRRLLRLYGLSAKNYGRK